MTKVSNNGRQCLYGILRHYHSSKSVEGIRELLYIVCGPSNHLDEPPKQRIYEHGFKSSKLTFLQILNALQEAKHPFDGTNYRILVLDYIYLHAAHQLCAGRLDTTIHTRPTNPLSKDDICDYDVVLIFGFDLLQDIKVGRAYEFLPTHLNINLEDATGSGGGTPLFILVRALRVPWLPQRLSSPHGRVFEIVSNKERS